MRTEKEILDVFGKELESFETSGTGIRNFTKQILCYMPDYFVEKEDCGDNDIVIYTKSCLAMANKVFELECFRDKFQASERDCIRSALLLQDAMFYGAGEERKRIHEHPEYIAIYVKNDKWEEFLPAFMRKEIAGMVASHEGEWNKKEEDDLKLTKPVTECEMFVHMVSRLVKSQEVTTQLPIVEKSYKYIYEELNGRNEKNIQDIAENMVKGQNWDGAVKKDASGLFIVLNSARVPVAGKLAAALQSISPQVCQKKNNFSNPYGN